MKWMGWSRFDLENAYPEDIDAIIELIGEEQAAFRQRK